MKKFVEILGESEHGSFNFDHDLGTSDILVAVYDIGGRHWPQATYSVTQTSINVNLNRINVTAGTFKVVAIG